MTRFRPALVVGFAMLGGVWVIVLRDERGYRQQFEVELEDREAAIAEARRQARERGFGTPVRLTLVSARPA